MIIIKGKNKEFINDGDGGEFTAYVPLSLNKDGQVNIIEKSIGEGDSKKIIKYVRGEASNNNVDKANERVSKSFLKKMASTLVGLNVFMEHEHHLTKTLGFIDAAEYGDSATTIDTALEDESKNPLVKMILDKMSHGTKMFYSIAGKITKAVKGFDESLQKDVTELEDGEIWEVSITALPEGNVNYISGLQKSLKNFVKMINDNESPEESISKALTEMVQSSEAHTMLSDFYWAFKDAIWNVIYNTDLTPEEKKNKILAVSDEFSNKVEELSVKIAELANQIDSELN